MAKAKPVVGLHPDAPTIKNAQNIARSRLEEMYSWDRYVDNPYSIHELHNLRIAAKRLRYTFEIFKDEFPAASQAFIEELTRLQDQLGELHDSDVMIALLRLCLGSQDSGTVYEIALVKTKKQRGKVQFVLRPELIADLVDPGIAPSLEERYGLEQLLLGLERKREAQYTTFRQHWYQLHAQDFRREILAVLDA